MTRTLAKLIIFGWGDKLGFLKIAIASSCLMIVPQVQVKAASVTVLNPSFEAPTAPQQPGGQYFSNNDITNWVLSSSGGAVQGVFNPSASQAADAGNNYYDQPVPHGVQVAFSNGGSISQQLSAVLQPNRQYTLGAFVGRRNNVSFPGYNIELLAGNTVLASNNSIIPVSGTFAPVTVNYTSGRSDPLIGQPLQIRLTSLGTQTNFDNITLDASPIPEPSAILGLLGFGLLGIGSTLKQKR